MKLLIRFFLCCLPFVLFKAHAALDLELTQGINSAIPIAIVPFLNQGATNEGANLSRVIQNDLKNSGRFKFVAFDESSHKPHNFESVNFDYWKKLRINGLIVGKVLPLGQDKKLVSFQLLDPLGKSKVLVTKQYKVNSQDMRALAHHISDLIYQYLSGDKGIFSTRIAYVLVNRISGKLQYNLEVADFDGHNPQSLLTSSQPIMSPSWSPSGKEIAYVSFENKRAQIFVVNIETGKRRLISSFPGINGAPAWSPDGQQLAVVLSKSGHPKIYLVNMRNRNVSQLTHGVSIDTEPNFSPSGDSLLFTSDRGGSPQIYQIDLKTKQVSRVTFDGNYNARASFSPNGEAIIMLHRNAKGFNIGIQDVKSGQLESLTFSGNDESPSFAPNGRLILYASRYQGKGVLNVVSTDGSVRLRLPANRGEVQEPAWSPFLG